MSENQELTISYDTGEGPDRPMIVKINEVLNRELSDPKAMSALLATTFKGLDAIKAKQALMEGMIRGYTFQNFMKKDIYAVPFGNGYSLVTSIDDARKRGMKNGVIGKGAPEYTYKDAERKKVESCTITIKRLVDGHIGEFTAQVDFDEYTTGKNLWTTKPKTMIAKVAEMHALRMACPEDLSQAYVEEEFDMERAHVPNAPSRLPAAKKTTGSLTMGNLERNAKKENGSEKEGGKNEPEQAAESDEAEDKATPPD